ncbi:MAG: DUF3891 family protein [Chloroflexi bacterium]|nr:DUF3891 family protein [Chloroflexota bacterium]
MIVNPTQNGWEVIYQPAHALLAAKIAAHWRADQRPQRWLETLVSLAQHDDESGDWSGNGHLSEVGAPLDFSLRERPSLDQPELVTDELQSKGQWAALMISMHMSFLYEHLRDESREYAAFLDQQLDHQKAWRSALKVSKKEADEAYALFQWCDRMSLILCRRELPDAERALEVSPGPDGTRYDVVYKDEVVTVQPWPFEESHFTVSVESIQLEQLRFKDDPELLKALRQTPVTELSWAFKK